MTGKYSSEIKPTFFLAIPYMLVPCWAGLKVFNQSRAPTYCTPIMVGSLPSGKPVPTYSNVPNLSFFW